MGVIGIGYVGCVTAAALSRRDAQYGPNVNERAVASESRPNKE